MMTTWTRYLVPHNEDDVDFHCDCFSYNGIVVDPNERDSLAKDLGPNNKVKKITFKS